MKTVKVVSFVCVAGMVFCCGCEPATEPEVVSVEIVTKNICGYSPTKIRICSLTGFTETGKLSVYVELLDEFGTQIKAAGVFRVEIYEYVQRSAEPKGRRIHIWPDINLIETDDNNLNWRDFLRAYEFELHFKYEKKQSYILEVTFFSLDGKRFSEEFVLKPQNS